MSTNQSNKEAWRKFLGIKDPSATLESGRVGGSIGRTTGRSGGGGGGGELDSDSVPEGDGNDGAEKGDGAGDAGEQIKQGDEFDRLEDLYDCETGEEVTIDGLGEKGSENYPTGFNEEKCKTGSIDCDVAPSEMMIKYQSGDDPYVPNPTWGPWYVDQTGWKDACVAAGHEMRASGVNEYCYYKKGTQYEYIPVPSVKVTYSGLTQSEQDEYCERQNKWPAVDRNHLAWNKEKGCFEPLCPELNNQVLDKYKACESERILCDKDGNKVKVTVDGDTVKVTQAKYNQTAEIKNGKVQTVKKLSESQTEAEFK